MRSMRSARTSLIASSPARAVRGAARGRGARASAEAVRLAAASADQGMAVLVVAEIIRADGARRDEAVGAGVVELDEQAGAGGARDVALEGRADAVGEEMGEQAVEGLAFRFHGAALGGRGLGADLAERGGRLLPRPARAAGLQGAGEAPVDAEGGGTADRRGEMRVA